MKLSKTPNSTPSSSGKTFVAAAMIALIATLKPAYVEAQRFFENITPNLQDPAELDIFTTPNNTLGQGGNTIDTTGTYPGSVIIIGADGKVYDTEAEVSPSIATGPNSMNIQGIDFASAGGKTQDIRRIMTTDHLDSLDLSGKPIRVSKDFFTANGNAIEGANVHFTLPDMADSTAIIFYSDTYKTQSGIYTGDLGVAFYKSNGNIERITAFQGSPFPIGESFATPVSATEEEHGELSVGPNPASEWMNINIPGDMLEEIGGVLPIYNMNGELVQDVSIKGSKTANYGDGSIKCQSDVSKLPVGVYQILIPNGGNIKFVIVR